MKRYTQILKVLSFAILSFSPCPIISASSDAKMFAAPGKPISSFDVGTIHVEKYGTGKQVLVFIPGLSSGPWVWYDTMAKLGPSYTFYTITLPGFDGHPATLQRPLFASAQRDIWNLLTKERIARPVIIGHSLGGTLAIALAEEHSDRLAGIIAVDGLPVFPMTANATPDQRKSMAEKMAADYTAFDPSEAVSRNKTYMKTIGTNRSELVDPTAKLEARSDTKAVGAWIKEVLENDFRADLPKVTVPFLEVMPFIPPEVASPMNYTQDQTLLFYRMLLAGAPKSTVVPIAPSKHFAMLDQPAAFQHILHDFLDSLPKPQ